jgi:hypothetical protein
MSFWDDLSPGVKRYAVIGAALLAVLLSMRHCGATGTGGTPPPPRGAVR